jgi:prepilin-type processing-associated H-X9-DG protein
VKSVQLFRCPSNSANDNTFVPASGGSPEIKVSYLANARIFLREDWASATGYGLKETMINSPATRVMITEGRTVGSQGDIGFWYNNGAGEEGGFREHGFAGHLGTMTVLFADGHVKSLRPTRTMSPVNMWGGFQSVDNEQGCGQPWGGNSGMNGYVNCEVPSQMALLSLQRLEALYQ